VPRDISSSWLMGRFDRTRPITWFNHTALTQRSGPIGYSTFIRPGLPSANAPTPTSPHQIPLALYSPPAKPSLKWLNSYKVSRSLHRRGHDPLTWRVFRQTSFPSPPPGTSGSKSTTMVPGRDQVPINHRTARLHPTQNERKTLLKYASTGGVRSFTVPASLTDAVRNIDHRSQPLLSCVTILVPICCDLPLAVHSASDSSIPVDPTAPAHSRLTSRSFPPDEAITSKDETRLTDYLRGDAAQTFIDVVYKVRRHMPSLPRSGLIALTLAIDLSIRLWISQISHHGSGGSV